MKSGKKYISRSSKISIGITMGDPAGIGPRIIAKALAQVSGLADFIIIGDKWVFDQVTLPVRQAGKSPCYKFIDLDNVQHKNFQFGKVRAEYGRAAMEYLDKALELIETQEIDGLVTCPLSKEAVNLAGFSGFSGHTEYLARYAKVKNYVMMLANKYLRFSLVTRHIPLAKVSKLLSIGDICATIALTQRTLKDFFAISDPRLVVLGLNPHASDNGLIGDEEKKIITPAVKIMRKKIKRLDGPLPADVGVRHLAQRQYDAAIAMYHDQALIPLKLSGGLSGTNLTLGLPFVRVSPLHGTAFDIAGTDKADATSLLDSIKLAIQCVTNQKNL